MPCVIIAGGFMSMLMAKMSSRGQVAYAEAGNVVDQTVGAIRTVRHSHQFRNIEWLICVCTYSSSLTFILKIEQVASFTGEKKAIEKYNSKIKVAYTTTVQQGIVSGLGMGTLLLIIFCTYGLAMWYGSKLVVEKGYNGGTVMTVIITFMTGGL